MTTAGCSCGCCTGITDRTPVRTVNRPGLREIVFRTGRYATFRESMIAGLTRSDRPALAALRTRAPADFSIALIDAWAVAADVLTFYTERTANENYLGTATERRSVSGIVGLIGYRLGPGVAAQTALAFSVDTSPGSPTTVPIVSGAKVQTLPGPGELPQTFETVEELTALAEWNAPVVRQTEPRVPRDGDPSVLLTGAATGVNRGDTLLFVAGNATADAGFAVVRVTAVSPDAAQQRTAVTFAPRLSRLGDGAPVRVYAMRQRAALFGYNAVSPRLFVPEVKTALGALLNSDASEWAFAAASASAVDLDALYEGIAAGTPVVLSTGGTPTLAAIDALSEASRTDYGISAKVTRLDLGAIDADPDADPDVDPDLSAFGGPATRQTVLLLRAEEVTLAEVPVVAPVFGGTIDLAAPPTAVEGPRAVLVRGRRAQVSTDAGAGAVVVFDDGSADVPAASVQLTVLAIEPDRARPGDWVVRVETAAGGTGTVTAAVSAFTFLPAPDDAPVLGETALVTAIDGSTLVLSAPLSRVYDRHQVTGRGVEIWGNVATATHGESVIDEVLGSGDAARPFQRFPLRRPPLTHVQAPTPSGGVSTLQVFVNEVQWQEVPTLFGHGPRDRVFATTTTDDGTTVVQFGDGVSGARPPTGQDNIRARYRAGVGLAGLAAADQLSLLMTRPLGVRGVRNPLAATGAQDPQLGVDAAGNAPRTVLTLDRIVSLRDYEDFAAGVGGIGKAAATWTWDGVVRGVIVTVAGIRGATVDPAGPLMTTLTSAVLAAGNPRVPLVIRPAAVGRFALEATLVLDPQHVPGAVVDAARERLLDHFSFTRRAFGQIVSLGEVDEVLHGVRGVVGVLFTRLHRTGETAVRNPFILARALLPGRPPAAEGAEVLTIDPDEVLLGVAP
jgi:hypothetical protein